MRNTLVSKLKIIAITFVVAAIIMKIAYSSESLAVVAKTTLSLFWLFVIPGYAMTLYWKDSLGPIERLAAGTISAMAITGILSYYIGIAGLKIQNQTIILPAAIIAISLALTGKMKQGQKGQEQPEQKA